jgi:hypothetical protein
MIDANFVDKIVSLAPVEQFDIHGLKYSKKGLVLVKPPEADAFTVTTLDGFVNMLEAGIDGFDVDKTVVHVVDHQTVQLAGRKASSYGTRLVHLTATPAKGITGFNFNSFTAQEDFLIGLHSHFQKSEDLDYLLRLASHIDLKETINIVDSGVAQEVTVRNGVAFKETQEAKIQLALKPYRTFRELDQPASNFVFRVKAGGGGMALFEADGGAWKIDAINAIASWLTNRTHISDCAQLGILPIIS